MDSLPNIIPHIPQVLFKDTTQSNHFHIHVTRDNENRLDLMCNSVVENEELLILICHEDSDLYVSNFKDRYKGLYLNITIDELDKFGALLKSRNFTAKLDRKPCLLFSCYDNTQMRALIFRKQEAVNTSI